MASIKGTKTIWQNKWLSLIESTVRHPARKAQPARDSKWIHVTRNRKHPNAVVIVAFVQQKDDDFKLLLTEEFRAPLKGKEFGFPAGLVNKGETPLQAATRELKEETGYKVTSVLAVSPVLYTSAGMTDESFCYVLVTAAPDGKAQLEPNEDIKFHEAALDDIQYLLKGKRKGKKIKLSGRVWPIAMLFSIISRMDTGGPLLDKVG